MGQGFLLRLQQLSFFKNKYLRFCLALQDDTIRIEVPFMKPIYPDWVVIDAVPASDYKIILKFADGSVRAFDFKPELQKPIYAHLNDPALFLKGHAEYDTVVWDDDTDIAPEFLYDHSVILTIDF